MVSMPCNILTEQKPMPTMKRNEKSNHSCNALLGTPNGTATISTLHLSTADALMITVIMWIKRFASGPLERVCFIFL